MSDPTECEIKSSFLHRPTGKIKTCADPVTLRQGWRICGAHARNGTRHSLLGPPTLLFKLFCPTSVSILRIICVYMHISDCVETVYAVPLLSNKTANATFLNKLGAVRSVDWIFINWSPAWRWLGEYVTLDRTFYSLLFKQEVTAAPVISTFSCRFPRGGLF
jgi:hypothetical protein